MRRLLSPFRRLGWKLTLSYTLVTVGALLIVELAGLLALQAFINSNAMPPLVASAFQQSLVPQILPYLEKDPPDLDAVLNTLNQTARGPSPNSAGISYSFSQTDQVLVLDPAGHLLVARLALAQPFEVSQVPGLAQILPAALAGDTTPERLYSRTVGGGLTFAIPVVDNTGKVFGVLVLVLNVGLFNSPGWSDLLRLVWMTSLVFTIASGAVGTVFGFLTAYGLTRRLKRVAQTASAWGRGDFSAAIVDSSADEIGQLAGQLNRMAQEMQVLIQTQQQLATVEERNRLARDLHDSVKQQVFAISMNLGAVQTLWERDTATARVRLDTAMTLARQAQQELAALIKTLRPAPLEGKALAPALGDWIQRWQAQTSLETRYQVTGQGELPEGVEQALFRVTQEALSNVAKHSGAQKVEVTLALQPGAVSLRISDDGHGFDPAQPQAGLGLRSMRERLQALGGQLEIASGAQGTCLTVRLPYATPLETNL